MNTALGLRTAPYVPWAEIVPGYGRVTVDILLTLPEDGYPYEVVEGVLVRMAGSGFDATTLGFELGAELRNYARPRRLGRVTGADGVYKFPGAETGLVPDVGFLTAAKVALIADRGKPIPFAPDLAVEVASPDQQPEALAAKARTHLDGETRLVWIVWPGRQEIDVWRAGRSVGPVAELQASDTLEGEDIVPGFSYPVASLFADLLA
jgi:Uma2 family endonuclease